MLRTVRFPGIFCAAYLEIFRVIFERLPLLGVPLQAVFTRPSSADLAKVRFC